jgi:hypothetical protein
VRERPESSFRPAPRWRLGTRHGAAHAGKSARSFAFNERLEGFPYDSGFLGKAGERLSFGKQIVIDGNRRSHVTASRHPI